MKTIPVLDSSFSTVFPSKTKVELAVYCFVDTPGGAGSLPMLSKMNVLRALANRGQEPFYVSDIFKDTSPTGGWMDNLKNLGLVKKTGNERETQYTVETWYGDETHTGHVKEWQVCVSPDEIIKALDTLKAFIIEHI